MSIVNLKIKKLYAEAIIPSYAKPGDAGMDLTAVSKHYDEFGNVSYGIGLAFEIPEGYVGLLFPRSSICKQDLSLTNCVGVIDSGYRGEVSVKFKPTCCFWEDEYAPNGKIGEISNSYTKVIKAGENGSDTFVEEYNIGDRVCQIIIMPYPKVIVEEVDNLSTTERGMGGFGHTGKN